MTAFTRTRIVALTLIGLAVFGLAYVKVLSADDRVTVPSGAVAGDLILDPCTYSTEDGDYAADCGTLVVPENRSDPQSRLIAVPVTRIRALSPHPAEPIFRLEGGPGLTNMDFSRASRLADDHDVVLVGYRGVDGSVRLDCPEVEVALKRSPDFLARETLDAYAGGFRACAARLKGEHVDLARYGLVQQVDDLETARVALGYERIDLVSESAGTRTAMIYAWRYPESIHRSVMIGVNPPGHFLWDTQATQALIDRYAGLCARDSACSGRTDDLAALIERIAADIPDRWLFLPIEEGNVRLASFFGLMETTPELDAPIYASTSLASWLSADEGDASGFWFQSFAAALAYPEAFVWGQYAAAARVDAGAATEYFSTRDRGPVNLGGEATEFVWAGGQLVDAWPAAAEEDEYSLVRRSDTETLLVGGALDFATPPEIARKELLPNLPNGRQVVLTGFGHSTDFWTYQPEASTRLLTTFFHTGRVDDSLYEAQPVDFTPELPQTALGKGFAGTMAGLGVLTVLSLLWMPMHVLARGRFGRKTSAFLRSVWAAVLGLGGWLAGVLGVIMAMPSIALDDERLAVVSIGAPVGLCVYWAWVRRGRPGANATGFLASAAGALAGAWFGFHAAADLLALVTAIVGATAGANLLLIALDIATERLGREATPAPARAQTWASTPSSGRGTPAGSSASTRSRA